jgi:hypothetical protein
MLYLRAVELPDPAARALAAVRQKAGTLRFEIKKGCEQERWRLKVCYRTAGQGTDEREIQVGLLWCDDLGALEALRARLEAGEPR